MASTYPKFFSQPFRYLKWAEREKPAIFYACVLGFSGPPLAIFLPPIRRYFGDVDPPPVPLTYPVPTGPRKIPEGYDDE